VVGTPAVSNRSFRATGTPWSGPAGSRRTRAASAVTVMNAFSRPSTASSRSSAARVTSTGDTWRRRMASATSARLLNQRSARGPVAGPGLDGAPAAADAAAGGVPTVGGAPAPDGPPAAGTVP